MCAQESVKCSDIRIKMLSIKGNSVKQYYFLISLHL